MQLALPVSRVYIVENVQTGLAFTNLPDSIVLMGLGYNVDLLAYSPWLESAKCFYWGDIDTHGLAILNRARSYLPNLKSILMDEAALMQYKNLWVTKKEQHSASELTLLSEQEQLIYQNLKQQIWGKNVRLEQERISWEYAWRIITSIHKLAPFK